MRGRYLVLGFLALTCSVSAPELAHAGGKVLSLAGKPSRTSASASGQVSRVESTSRLQAVKPTPGKKDHHGHKGHHGGHKGHHGGHKGHHHGKTSSTIGNKAPLRLATSTSPATQMQMRRVAALPTGSSYAPRSVDGLPTVSGSYVGTTVVPRATKTVTPSSYALKKP
jgi:hypothetical protein